MMKTDRTGAYLYFPRGVLLHPDPEERPEVVEQSLAAGSAALQQLDAHEHRDELPRKARLRGGWVTQRNGG